jgi:hypothetical protein
MYGMKGCMQLLRNSRLVAGALVAVAALLLSALPCAAAPSSRPLSGIGVLVMRSLNPDISVDTMMLPLYDEPGLRRIGTTRPSALPRLSSVIAMPGRDLAVAVLQKKSNWLLIAYDDAGREGWIELQRSWQYVTWDNWLKGRVARLLPDIKKPYAQLYREPSASSGIIDVSLQQKQVRIIQSREDWIQVLVNANVVGWLRWRDSDGRFLVQLNDRFSQQIR